MALVYQAIEHQPKYEYLVPERQTSNQRQDACSLIVFAGNFKRHIVFVGLRESRDGTLLATFMREMRAWLGPFLPWTGRRPTGIADPESLSALTPRELDGAADFLKLFSQHCSGERFHAPEMALSAGNGKNRTPPINRPPLVSVVHNSAEPFPFDLWRIGPNSMPDPTDFSPEQITGSSNQETQPCTFRMPRNTTSINKPSTLLDSAASAR
ncbi:MAG: hypothetical protein WBW33_30260 [Bryobacteraceae bacterium]